MREKSSSFWQLLLMNLRLVYRNPSGVFWTVVIPSIIYAALSVLPIRRLLSVDLPYSTYVLPGVVALTVMQGGIYSLAYWVVDLKARGVIKRLLVTPLKVHELALSLIAARSLIAVAQAFVLTVIGIFVFNATFEGNVLPVLVLVLLGAGIFLAVGLLISNYASSYESAAPITSAVGLPLTLLGNIFYPIELLPNSLQTVANLMPITYLADGLRVAFLSPDFTWALISRDIGVLVLWLVLLLGVTVAVFRLKE